MKEALRRWFKRSRVGPVLEGAATVLDLAGGAPLSTPKPPPVRPAREALEQAWQAVLGEAAPPAQDGVAGLCPATPWGSTRGDAERAQRAGGPPSSMSGDGR